MTCQDRFGDHRAGHDAVIRLPDSGPPIEQLKIGNFSGIPYGIKVDPQFPPVVGSHDGPQFAFRPPKNGGPNDALLGGKDRGIPVGFPG